MLTSAAQYHTQYLLYCSANGIEDPEAMLARDRERWSGGSMTGYVLWNSKLLRRWKEEHGFDRYWSPCEARTLRRIYVQFFSNPAGDSDELLDSRADYHTWLRQEIAAGRAQPEE